MVTQKTTIILLNIIIITFFQSYLIKGAIEWNLPATQISAVSNGTPTNEPFIASDGAGSVVAVWVQGPPTSQKIYGSAFNVVTKSWSSPDIIANTPSSAVLLAKPKATIIKNNQAVVAWWESDTSGNNFRMATVLYSPKGPLTSVDYLTTTYDSDTSTLEYSLINYFGQALLTCATSATATTLSPISIYSLLFVPNGSSTSIKVSTGTPSNLTMRTSPYVAIQPITNIPYVVWAEQSAVPATNYVVGTQLPIPLNYPTNFITFTQGSLNPQFPQVAFNIFDNSPYAFFANSSLNIGASAFKTPTTFDLISNKTLYTGQNIRFNVAADAANLFKVVYTQNGPPHTSINYTYLALYTPGQNAPDNIQISMGPSVHNLINIPQIQNISTFSQGNVNVILWEQNNQVWASLYKNEQGLTDITQLSNNANGNNIGSALATNTQVELAMTSTYGLPIVAWNQGNGSSFQVFGTQTQLQPSNVQIIQQTHAFPFCTDLVNVITWSPLINAYLYRIYCDSDLTPSLATIYANDPLIFKHYGRNFCGCNRYYLYAINGAGQSMPPVVITGR